MSPRFRAHAYVCGAVGRWNAEVLDRLRTASPPGLREVKTTGCATLWASADLETWGDDGCLWWPLTPGAPPTSWEEAAERRTAAGLVTGPGTATLHSDAVGLQELYTRRYGDALYFAVRIDPLLALDESALHADWPAWASIFTLTCPLGEDTPFEEIRRVEGATAWRWAEGRLERLCFEPSWLAAEPDDRIGPGELVELVADNLPREAEGVAVPLSGGWDSRLLAMLVRRRSPDARLMAWTTSNDDGWDDDIDYARVVARALDMRHLIVMPGAEAWRDDHIEVRCRTQYQTTHHAWQAPLARILRERRETVLDGLIADVIFRGEYPLYDEVTEAPSPSAARALTWDALSKGRYRRHDRLAPGISEAAADMGRASFGRVMSRTEGAYAAPILAWLLTRTARAIAAGPLWMLAPESRVSLPFVHPDLLGLGLRVPLHARRDDVLYRAMLGHVNADVAALPSTRDGRRGRPPWPRRQGSRAARKIMADAILAGEVAPALLAPELRRALTGAFWTIPTWTLHTVGMFAQWEARYRSRLAPITWSALSP